MTLELNDISNFFARNKLTALHNIIEIFPKQNQKSLPKNLQHFD